ncbi:MAG: hypothetical protein QXI91_05325 [Candidatus Bathyarchaeia archaeon]
MNIFNFNCLDTAELKSNILVVVSSELDASNPTLIDVTLDGSQYALCTTLQYFGFKPASAAATLTVEPQSTLLLTANKTPEQLKQEAKNNE